MGGPLSLGFLVETIETWNIIDIQYGNRMNLVHGTSTFYIGSHVPSVDSDLLLVSGVSVRFGPNQGGEGEWRCWRHHLRGCWGHEMGET